MVLPVILLIILGLIMGSFFTAFIHRLYVQESVARGRSKCPHCQHVLSVLDLIPVLSFALLGGKCRYCKKKISWFYPAVEIGTVIYFVAGYFAFGLTWFYLGYLLVASLMYLLLVFDWRYGLVPDALSLPAIILTLLLGLFMGQNWWDIIIGAFLGFAFFAIQYFPSRGRWVGDGDLRLGVLLGACLGYRYLWLGLLLAYLAGAIVALTLIALGKKKFSSQIPLGPFLLIAAWVVYLYGPLIVNWYWHLLA